MKNHGSDFLVGNSGKPAAPVRKLAEGIYISPEEVEAVVRDLGQTGKRVAGGIKGVVGGLELLKQSGLTGEALVVLVAQKCSTYITDGGRTQRPNAALVQCVLEGLLRIGEYVR